MLPKKWCYKKFFSFLNIFHKSIGILFKIITKYILCKAYYLFSELIIIIFELISLKNMHKASISFSINEYKFKISINKILKNGDLENLIVLRLKKLITKNKYIKQLLANKKGNIAIYFRLIDN